MGNCILGNYVEIIVLFRFKLNISESDELMVKTWFLNPYTDRLVHYVICPSHQVILITYYYGT